ncbi:transposase [Flavobacterium arsenatis]|uniref:Transposase n=1 Tax=Flavobacterium arsenatis TaxID=1484332 RepID=A0ABU1TSB0_9FLAO|nr:hypothetical protein [Flavobacterium arsenatis]MDR6968769.1 transposase [Flavobacterium arsenatis]
MKELLNQIIKDRNQSAEKFKEKVAFEFLFEGKDPKEIVEAYQLASVHTVQMWVCQYKSKIKEGLITLPIMTEQEKETYQLFNIVALIM